MYVLKAMVNCGPRQVTVNKKDNSLQNIVLISWNVMWSIVYTDILGFHKILSPVQKKLP